MQSFEAFGPPEARTSVALVRGCFGVPVRGWSPELTPIAEERMDSIVASIAARLGETRPFHARALAPSESEADARLAVSLRVHTTANDDGPENSGVLAKTRIAFTAPEGKLSLCFALCDERAPSNSGACEGVRAPFGGPSVVAPRGPGAVLATTLAVMRHPRESTALLVCLAAALGFGLLRTGSRRRKRGCSETRKAC